MINFSNKIANRKINEFVKKTYKKIKVKPGLCRYNYRCQMNAVHEAFSNKDKRIAMVMCIDEYDTVYIHFINYTNKKFVDNTLGVWAIREKYYFVKWIKEKDFYNVNDIFWDYRGFLQSQLNWWIRLTNNQDF